MPKVTGPLLSFSASGSVSPLLTFSIRKSGQQVRYQKKQKDVLTDDRIEARANYSAAVSAWNVLSAPEKLAYSLRAKNLTMTGYNLFMKENIVGAPLLQIGDSYQGGIIFYLLENGDTGYNPNVQHGLIAPLVDQSASKIWHVTNDGTTGATATAIGTGAVNTTAVLALYGAEDNAAKLCADFSVDEYNDWHLPSKDEMTQMAWQKVLLNMADNDWYWTSSEYSSSRVYMISTQFGQFTLGYKFFAIRVRACRSF